jgi:uncharacterized membrane protein YkvI
LYPAQRPADIKPSTGAACAGRGPGEQASLRRKGERGKNPLPAPVSMTIKAPVSQVGSSIDASPVSHRRGRLDFHRQPRYVSAMPSLLNSRFVRLYIVPGAVYQSVMVGGGYGTGREIVEYFTSYGVLGGLLGFCVSFVTVALVLALTFELSRLFRVYDYRNFFKTLLGPGWLLYELLVILQFLLVLAVLASAAGNISEDSLNIPYEAGLAVMLAVIAVLTFFGREVIAKALTYWSLFLYIVFIAFFILIFRNEGDAIMREVAAAEVVGGWAVSGFKYAMYNLAMVPLLLYVARDFETRRETVGAGVCGAVIALLPAVVFHMAFFSAYPDILAQPIPVYWLLGTYGTTAFLLIYSVMLFGTFIETGAGLLQGINERIDAFLIERRGSGLSSGIHATIAVLAVVVSAVVSLWGITNLIARGYGTMAWVFFAVYIIPLLTVGTWKIYRHRS